MISGSIRIRCAGALGLVLLASCTGCAGNGKGLDQGGRPLPPGGSSGGVLTANFDSIQQNVFTPVCSVCHAGSNAPQGLHLDAANSYSQLVGIPSSEVPSLLRVKPGDPANSYVVQKIEGHAAVGGQMPLGGAPLPAATIAVIRQWISDGALRSPTANATVRFATVSAVPSTGDRLDNAPARIIIEFSKDLDQTQIDATSVHLEAMGESTAAAEILPVALTVPAGNTRTLMVEPLAPLMGGRHYRVIVGGLSRSGLSAVSGERLGDVATVVTEFDVAATP